MGEIINTADAIDLEESVGQAVLGVRHTPDGKLTVEEIVELLEQGNTSTFADELKELASEYPETRDVVVKAFNTYMTRHKRSRGARMVDKMIAEILILEMLETFKEEKD